MGAASPTCRLPKFTGSGVCALALARRKTEPVTLTVCEASAVLASPLVPVPSLVRVMVAVPFLLPAATVVMPTLRLVLLVRPAPSRVKEPALVVTPPVAPPMVASSFSEKPSFGTLLVILSNWLGAAAPTWKLPKFTGSGVCAVGLAKRNADPVIVRFCSATLSKLLITCTTCPVSAPALVALKVTPRLPVAAPSASGPKFEAVTPAPLSRASVILPPFAKVWRAPRSDGPVVPALLT